MASTPASKGTRKTYSFEEREILVNLIYKYLVDGDEEKTPDTSGSGSKRKSAWSQLTDEYNSLVGSDNARTSIQLRRCWENMKANKKNRDDKRTIERTTTDLQLQLPSTSMRLPPNVMFQPNDSEPFTFEGMLPSTFQTQDSNRDDKRTTEKVTTDNLPLQLPSTSMSLPPNVIFQPSDSEPLNAFEGMLPSTFQKDSNRDIELNGHAADGTERVDDRESVAIDEMPVGTEDPPTKKMKKKSPKKQVKQKVMKTNKIQKNELYEYTISEAQLKLDTAALLKEEAKLKLEEAEYRKEEARMRMICANYKLQRLREDCEAAIDDREEK